MAKKKLHLIVLVPCCWFLFSSREFIAILVWLHHLHTRTRAVLCHVSSYSWCKFNVHPANHAPNKVITSSLLNFKLNYTLIKFTLTQKFNLKWLVFPSGFLHSSHIRVFSLIRVCPFDCILHNVEKFYCTFPSNQWNGRINIGNVYKCCLILNTPQLILMPQKMSRFTMKQ